MDTDIWNSITWLVLESRVLGESINPLTYPGLALQRWLSTIEGLEVVPSYILEQAQRRLQLEIGDLEAEWRGYADVEG